MECRVILSPILVTVCLFAPVAADDGEQFDFFESEIRPLLVAKCSRCHNEEKQKGELRVDSRAALLKGGARGPAIVPEDPAKSLLLTAVRREGKLKMPPGKKLSDREIDALTHWVQSGAAWPEENALAAPESSDTTEHWAFRPVREPKVPVVGDSTAVRTEVDTFVLAKLAEHDLAPSSPTDRRTLIRRVSYSLVGLPPTAEEVSEFVNDPRPNAYEALVDRLLRSPQYGEHWGRHWLDVARYSDTKGYVYAREERFWVHAWTYRDWVVKSLNADMPYDRFLLLQLAADQVEDRQDGDLAAMGFLTLGRRFLGVIRDIIDDRIDVVSRGTMGLTVSCARCHDHKYDPIATADYYSLYGVFDSCAERIVRLPKSASASADDVKTDANFEGEFRKRQEKLRGLMATSRAEAMARARTRIRDYLETQTRLNDFPAQGFDQLLHPHDLVPAFVRRWEEYLRYAEIRQDPIFVPWHAYAAIPADSFREQTGEVTSKLRKATDEVHPLVAELFHDPPASFDEVIERYSGLFSDIDAAWTAEIETAPPHGSEAPLGFSDPAMETLRRVIYGEGSPCEVPNESIANSERYFDTVRAGKLWNLQGEVNRWVIRAEAAVPFAMVLEDRAAPTRPRIFRRGDPTRQGKEVPRQFLPVLAKKPRPFQRGSGRLELAKAIASPTNALTARVIVNRVWAQHFGRGLVATPSDFGLRADPPTHPELLDWLAARFVAEKWSLKKLHRRIVLSATFRQTSTAPTDAHGKTALAADPSNSLLWRMNPHRLTFEEFRDSMLAVAGELDPQVGGKPFDLFSEPFQHRRTLYGLVDRQFFPTALRTFDFANPDLHIPQRRETTVPQQALFFMNHPLVLDRARSLANLVARETTPEAGVRALFQKVYQRNPTAAELSEARQLVNASTSVKSRPLAEGDRSGAKSESEGKPKNTEPSVKSLNGWEQLAHLVLCTNEFVFID